MLLEAATGTAHPHSLELNIHSGTGSNPVLIVQPATPLKHGTRYVAGVRRLVDANGVELPPTPGFVRLRDDHLPPTRAAYFQTHVFPVLHGAGFAGANGTGLQLAWDFTTVSANNSIGRVESMRDQALQYAQVRRPLHPLAVPVYLCVVRMSACLCVYLCVSVCACVWCVCGVCVVCM